MSEKTTKGVQLLRGDPKKAIVRLSIPMMIGMSVQTLYNLADGIWVSGLGPESLAAVGLFFPVFMGIIALAAGLGVGTSSAIARRIGARDKEGADNVAVHSLILSLILGVTITITMLPAIDSLFRSMGAKGEAVELAIEYARVLLAGAFIIVFNNVGNGILRGEGDANRAMLAMVLGSGLNIVLDPIFIYTLGFGVVGAAYATLLSMVVTSLFIAYWLFVKRDTYVDITLRDFSPSREILKDILRVGLPSSLSQLSMSIAMFFLNSVAITAGGENGVAVFTSAWRITMLGIVPILGMAAATTSVTGAAYGERNVEKLETAYLYAIKIAFMIELAVVAFIMLFAPQVAYLFTYSESAQVIKGDLISALRTLPVFLVLTPFGMMTSAMFQGIGEGEKSLILTIFRTLVMQVGFAYIFVHYTTLGLRGVWIGIVIGNMVAAIVGFLWGRMRISALKKTSATGGKR
ncbi:MATE family efflux transporter [Pyrococcus furiosus DSM 3638]|uniref:MATE family efflux transporter n=4 Tax=Pyrococcus furiosus TaxID=2261 RepID=A0A5C0XUH0_PYRFU|nr:MATE family efflux transporter [Pyrococcus furiosus]3VVN_A Chain A, Crystal structure of MATE in the straight conformation [Pyrococcus furiosus DSM 3638]3VVO_A Chain A, Crystal structure of MATE in the bent conformation [Pyrococcus furiosus]3VVP_A Chain A, Crystal structure of MATE in complex with Br-NRF [Pyrococcus furiosus]3VVP_B Chain B, Crystal structure of MATE in complex with Br-NRF [Pyrococcus furiosus]3VVR_A Chain A, Crystal structure of MATE in complex with MaD5 [Pyrococcus furiosu